MAKWGLARRFRIGINDAQMSRMVEHKEIRIYMNSTIYNNNKINK
jgi:hypothetical protein